MRERREREAERKYNERYLAHLSNSLYTLNFFRLGLGAFVWSISLSSFFMHPSLCVCVYVDVQKIKSKQIRRSVPFYYAIIQMHKHIHRILRIVFDVFLNLNPEHTHVCMNHFRFSFFGWFWICLSIFGKHTHAQHTFLCLLPLAFSVLFARHSNRLTGIPLFVALIFFSRFPSFLLLRLSVCLFVSHCSWHNSKCVRLLIRPFLPCPFSCYSSSIFVCVCCLVS